MRKGPRPKQISIAARQAILKGPERVSGWSGERLVVTFRNIPQVVVNFEVWAKGSVALRPPQIRIVVQARMQSRRLPGKVLARLGERPLLEYVVMRLAASCHRDHLLVATSTSAADDALEHFCRRLDVACRRGSEADVLGRYVAVTSDLDDHDLVVRATADNPLYCPARTAAIIAAHRELANDYTCIANLSYVVPEVMRVGALRAMERLATNARSREHVTPYFREEEHAFRVCQLPPDWKGLRPEIRLTVDTPAELEQLSAICRAFESAGPLFSVDDVYDYLSPLALTGLRP